MKKFLIIIAIISLSLANFAQTSFSNQVLLFPIAENTTIKVNGEKKALHDALLCKKNSQIEILSGKVSLLTSTGVEITLAPGEKIKVTGDLKKKNIPNNSFSLNKISKFMDKPSVYLPNLYNNDRSEHYIFPLKSKAYDKSNIKFYCNHEDTGETEFKLYLKDNDSLIWQTNDPIKDINFKELPVKQGHTYTWRIYCGSNSLKGEIEILSAKQALELDIEPLPQKTDYLNAFFILLENECIFDALAILSAACKEYPQSEMFISLVNKLPIELN